MRTLQNQPFRACLLTAILGFFAAAEGPVSAQQVEITAGSAEARVLFERGRDAFHRTWFERADELLAESIRVDPDFAMAQAYKAAAEAFLYFDGSDRAAQAIELAAGATSGEQLMVAALAGFIDGDYESTAVSLHRIVEDWPDDSYARHALGFTLVDLGLPERGLPVLEALLEDEPTFFAAWNHLGYAYLETGEWVRAEQAMTRFVAEDPKNPSARDSLADVLAAMGRTDEAVASLARSTLLDGDYAYGMQHLGDLTVIDGDLFMARAAYRRSLAMANAYSPRFELVIRERIAGTWIRENQIQSADVVLAELGAKANDLGETGSALAAQRARLTVHLTTGDAGAAQPILTAYSKQVDALGDAATDHGEPSYLDFFNGWQAVVDGRYADAEDAITLLESRVSHAGSSELVLGARLLGELAFAQLDFEQAVDAFEVAGGSDPLVAIRLALAYDASGRPAAADALFETAAMCETFDVECALASALAAPLFDLDHVVPDYVFPGPGEPEPEEEPDDGSLAI